MARIPLVAPESTPLGVPSTEGINPSIDAAQRKLYTAVRHHASTDPLISELVRLRNAAAQNCQLCLGLRNRHAVEAGLSEADVTAATGGDRTSLHDKERSALVLADYFLGYPADIPDQAIREIRAALTDGEIAELVLELTLWTNNKVGRALGCDLPAVRYQIYDG